MSTNPNSSHFPFQTVRMKLQTVRKFTLIQYNSTGECVDESDEQYKELRAVGYQYYTENNCFTHYAQLFYPDCVYTITPGINFTGFRGEHSMLRPDQYFSPAKFISLISFTL